MNRTAWSCCLAISVALGTACATARQVASPVEGRTAGGIAYDVRGSGPVVVLVHGGVLDRRMWDEDVDALASHFRVVRYDLRGHGRSADVTGPYSSIDDLRSVLDAVGASRAHVIGLSRGGQIALDFALAQPERVDKLVLVGAAPSGMRVTERPPGADSLIAAVTRGDVDRAASLAAEMPAFRAPPDKATWVRGIVTSNARLFRMSPTADRPVSPPAMARLGEVRVPTLIIVGDQDSRDILAAADSLAAGVRTARRVTIPGAGHLVNVWDPRAFHETVRQFLTEGNR